jgi:hypothetical protein
MLWIIYEEKNETNRNKIVLITLKNIEFHRSLCFDFRKIKRATQLYEDGITQVVQEQESCNKLLMVSE